MKMKNGSFHSTLERNLSIRKCISEFWSSDWMDLLKNHSLFQHFSIFDIVNFRCAMCTFYTINIRIARAYFYKLLEFDANQSRTRREKRKRRKKNTHQSIDDQQMFFLLLSNIHVEQLAGRLPLELIALHSNYRFSIFSLLSAPFCSLLSVRFIIRNDLYWFMPLNV